MKTIEKENKKEFWVPVFRLPEEKEGTVPRKLIASFDIDTEKGKLFAMRNEKQEFVCSVPRKNLCQTEEKAHKQDEEIQKKMEFLKNLEEAWFADVRITDYRSEGVFAGVGKCTKKEMFRLIDTYDCLHYQWRVYAGKNFLAEIPFEAVFATKKEAIDYALREKQRLLRIEREKLNQIELQEIKEIK